tara:strand:+ start:1427 stop:1597 length:171 start_codon:yes stop_codon:yes gene_type:complete
MEKIRKILEEAINLTRWGDKTNIAFPFLDEDERKEIIDLFIETLEKEGYEIKKSKD